MIFPTRPTLLEKKQLLLLSKNFSGQALHRHPDISTQFNMIPKSLYVE